MLAHDVGNFRDGNGIFFFVFFSTVLFLLLTDSLLGCAKIFLFGVNYFGLLCNNFVVFEGRLRAFAMDNVMCNGCIAIN